MSDYIPFELQMDIINRLPMKSLVRFRSVSKQWKSLIDSSDFINSYHVTNTLPDHLLVRYKLDSDKNYVSFVDDDNFPENKYGPNVPLHVKLLRRVSVLGCSHGLLCLYGIYRYQDFEKEMVLLWNISIRKTVGIVVPDVLDMPYGYTVVGFGVCPNTNDPKLVKITRIKGASEFNTVEVFTLSSRAWRSISDNLPRISIVINAHHVFINGVIYWKAYDKIIGHDGYYNLIISFDLISEGFSEVYLPNRLKYSISLSISKLNDSLVAIEYFKEAGIPVCGVWMMNHGVQRSFTKLFTVKAPNSSIYKNVLGFRKNGKPIIETIDDRQSSAMLQFFDPSSEHINDLRIQGNVHSFYVSSYMETLLLLDHPGSIIYC